MPDNTNPTNHRGVTAGHKLRRRAPQRLDRGGWKVPSNGGEAPHPTYVEAERHRVICRECPWFAVHLGATPRQLLALGQWHRRAMNGDAA